MKEKLGFIFKSISAGFIIGLAAAIYLKCENRIVGTFLFSIGLITVLVLGLNLFTGKVGYIDDKKKFIDALFILLLNAVSAYLFGLLFRVVFGVSSSFDSRLAKTWYQLLFDGFACGVLIYLAVELYKKTSNLLVVILPVMAFILAGFEHSIADFFYFGASEFSLVGLLDLLLVIIGNSIGSLFIRLIQVLGEKK